MFDKNIPAENISSSQNHIDIPLGMFIAECGVSTKLLAENIDRVDGHPRGTTGMEGWGVGVERVSYHTEKYPHA